MSMAAETAEVAATPIIGLRVTVVGEFSPLDVIFSEALLLLTAKMVTDSSLLLLLLLLSTASVVISDDLKEVEFRAVLVGGSGGGGAWFGPIVFEERRVFKHLYLASSNATSPLRFDDSFSLSSQPLLSESMAVAAELENDEG